MEHPPQPRTTAHVPTTRICARHVPPYPPGECLFPPGPGGGGGYHGWLCGASVSAPRWDPALGASVPRAEPAQPRTRPARRAKKRERLGSLPRGLAYLAKLTDDPGNDRKYAAFSRYVQSRRPSKGRVGHATPLDRARAAEYADGRRGDLRRLISHRQEFTMPAGALAIVFRLACKADVSPRAVFEALVLIGLEAVADDLREHGTVRNVATFAGAPTSGAGHV